MEAFRDDGAEAIPQISREEVRSRLSDPALRIVNALPRAAWLNERIPGSLSLPTAEIEARAAEVLPDLSGDVAVYCASDH